MQEKALPTLTLSMIVKNEEEYLRECLESAKSIVDEVIIVDTGSTDKTVEIAKEYDAKVFTFDWVDDFAAARNFALSKSTGDWILYLDADERLCKGSTDNIKEITKTSKKEGYRCIVNCLDEIGGKPKLMRYTRLFYNNGKIQFKGTVHEQIDESLLQQGYRIVDSNIEIIHIGYNISKESLQQKASRNLNLLLAEYSRKNSSYYAYQLGNTYSIIEDCINAKKYYKLALNDESLPKEYRAVCYLYLAGLELENHKAEEALRLVTKGINLDRTHPLLNLLASQIYIRLNKAAAGIKLCKIAFEQNKKNLAKKDSSILTVVVSAKQIIYQGILTSLIAGSKPDVEYFLKELERSINNKSEYVFIKKLYEKEIIKESEIARLIDEINQNNLETVLFLVEQYPDKIISLKLLAGTQKKYLDNSKFLTKLGLLYLENNNYSESIKVLESSLELNEKDPAAVFYIISACIKINEWKKIPALIKFSENEFNNIPEFISKLRILKTKLEPYLNKL